MRFAVLFVVFAQAVAILAAPRGIPEIRTVPHELDILLKAGHIQGACCSEKAIYLSHQRGIEKLDWNGRHLAHVDAPQHLGDCAYHKGRIYGAFYLHDAKGDEKPGMVRVWDEDLKVVAERKLGDILGSIGVLNGTVYVGVTRRNGKPHAGCDMRRLDLSLADKGALTTVDLGYWIQYGAQVIDTDGRDLLVGCYGAGKDKGNPKGYNFSVLTPDLKVISSCRFSCSEGLARVPRSVAKRDTPVFMVVKALGGNMQKWRADPVNNPPRISLRFYEYVNGAFRDITQDREQKTVKEK